MCILNVTNLYCNCPHRDGLRCPHNHYIRSTTQYPTLPTTSEPTGFYLRRAGDFQRCIRWEPLVANQSWDHCSTFVWNRLTIPSACPETLAAGAGHVRARRVRSLCQEYVNGHPGLERRNAIRAPNSVVDSGFITISYLLET